MSRSIIGSRYVFGLWHLLDIIPYQRSQLDPFEYANATLGDEQFFDVELDRHTDFLPTNETLGVEADLFNFDRFGGESDEAEERRRADSYAAEPRSSIFCLPR